MKGNKEIAKDMVGELKHCKTNEVTKSAEHKHKWKKSEVDSSFQTCETCGANRSLSGRFGGGVLEDYCSDCTA